MAGGMQGVPRRAEHRPVETTRLGVGENNEHFHPREYFTCGAVIKHFMVSGQDALATQV